MARAARPAGTIRDPAGWSGPAVGVAFLTGVATAARMSATLYPRPWADPQDIRAYYTGNPVGARISAAGQLTSALALLVLTRSVRRLAIRTHPDTRWPSLVAGTSGAVAAAALAVSGALTATAATATEQNAATLARLHRTGFAAGGPIHGAAFGVLTGVLGLAARRSGLLGVGWERTALVSAAAGSASPLYFASRTAGWLIPLGRFPGLVIAAIAGVRLATARPS